MLINQFKRYFAILLLLTSISFSQNPQFPQSNIFFTDNYFFNIDSLAKLQTLNFNPVYYGQNDTIVFAGDTKNIFAYSKTDFHQFPELDTSLFYDLNYNSRMMYWNIVYLNGKKFSLDSKTHLTSEYDTYGNFIMTIPSNESATERDINGRDMLLKGSNTVVHVQDLNGEGGYVITAYDENGKKLWNTKTAHTEIEAKGDTRYYKRFLNFYECNSKYLIFTNNWFYKENPKTVIVNLSSGETTELPILASGVLFDKEDNLSGLLHYDEKENIVTFFKGISSEPVWEYHYQYRQVSPYSITGLLKDNILVIALYYPISTGSDLVALDINTGSLKWHAQVDRVNASHSKYYNHVNLFSYKDKILMEGIESYGRYLQVFDVNTGRKLFSEINKKY